MSQYKPAEYHTAIPENRILQPGDIVHFIGDAYEVMGIGPANRAFIKVMDRAFSHGNNKAILAAIEKSGYNGDAHALAAEVYGYAAPPCTIWPEAAPGDYAALTRLVNRLYDMLEGREVHEAKPIELRPGQIWRHEEYHEDYLVCNVGRNELRLMSLENGNAWRYDGTWGSCGREGFTLVGHVSEVYKTTK